MILALTPLQIEYDALTAAAPGVHCAVGGHGKVQFALTTQKLILELKPTLVVCAGACGALSDEYAILDVVVGERTIEHDYNLRFVKRPLPAFEGDRSAREKLKRERFPFPLHFANIASGDEDVMTSIRAREIRDLTSGAAVVAWEGAGLARAASYCQVPFLEIRVVTDTANDGAPADFKKNVQRGMKNIADVLRRL